MSSRRALTVALTVAVTAIGIASILTAQASAATSETGNVRAAVAYASAHGYHTSVAVLDTRTGRFYGAGDYNSAYASESVVKVFIAARLLATGQMKGSTAAMAYKMITQSDDNMATALYGRVGGDGVINWVKSYFHIPSLGSPPPHAGWWGGTRITARGMVYLYNVIKKNPKVGPWLINAMHHATRYGSDGTYQFFGIPAATSGAGIKQGWGMDYGDGSADVNTTGYVNNNRYTVAILARGPARTYGRQIHITLTAMARMVMPGGHIDVPAAHNPIGRVNDALARGSSVRIDGWTLDPDNKSASIRVAVYDGSHRLFYAPTAVARADVNRIYHATGNHGYRFTFKASNATHTYCVVYVNTGEGTANPRTCYQVAVNGAPYGVFDTATAHSDSSVALTGWAVDRDATSQSINVRVYDGSTLVGTFPANVVRPDVNTVAKVAGNHGFVVTLPHQTPGAHTYRVYAVNIGHGGPNILLARSPKTVTVPVVS